MLSRVFVAAEELLEDGGSEAVSIRAVAERAGVSTATAYTYIASKDHLFAELFWRRLEEASYPPLTGRSRTRRLRETTRQLADVIAARPALAAAVTKSLLGQDPDVTRLRHAIGATFIRRFTEALGEDVDPALLSTVTAAFNGTLLHAGMGYVAYGDLADELDTVVDVVMKGHR